MVTLKVYDQIHWAYFDKNLLAENGISSYIQDELTVQSDWYLLNAIGGIRLRVHKEDEVRALEILNTPKQALEVEHTIAHPKYQFVCPQCGSNHIYRSDQMSSVFAFSLLIGIPIPARSSLFKCYFCEHQWDQFLK